MRVAFFLGVDGGGSRCRARLCDGAGHVLGVAEGGAANVSLDFDGALATIHDVARRCLHAAGLELEHSQDVAAALGLAGVSSPAIAARVRAALPGFGRTEVVHDGVVACLGAHGGRDGGLVVAGTGSVAVLCRGGEVTAIGGRGFVLGDDGSGAWIGRALWRRALRAHDGLEPMSPLLEAMMAEFGGDPVRVIAWGRTAPSHQFAAYAARAFPAARSGDVAALPVVRDAARAIAELIAALRRHEAPRIALVGGMAAAIAPYLPESARDTLTPALADALAGALFLAGLPRTDAAPQTAAASAGSDSFYFARE